MKTVTDYIATAIEVDRAKRQVGLLQSPYLFNRQLRRAAFKRAAAEFKPAIQAAANREMKRMWQGFEEKVAVKVALRANSKLQDNNTGGPKGKDHEETFLMPSVPAGV